MQLKLFNTSDTTIKYEYVKKNTVLIIEFYHFIKYIYILPGTINHKKHANAVQVLNPLY